LDNTHFFTALSPKKFNWLLKNADVYIRNTDRDGDCVAIREAAYWGKKICASSVVTRPDGTELFSFNDKIEFKIAIQKVVNKPDSGKIEPGINYANNVYKLYKSLIQQM
jgi:hypothetical protein